MTPPPTEKASPDRPTRRLPWWIFVILAVGSYYALKYLLPGLHPANPTLGKILQAIPILAPLSSIVFLLLAAKRLYDTDGGSKEEKVASPNQSTIKTPKKDADDQ